MMRPLERWTRLVSVGVILVGGLALHAREAAARQPPEPCTCDDVNEAFDEAAYECMMQYYPYSYGCINQSYNCWKHLILAPDGYDVHFEYFCDEEEQECTTVILYECS